MIDLNLYSDFVLQTTSPESLQTETMMARCYQLNKTTDLEVSQALTASIGMQAESGEFAEVIKKVVFQGKEWTEENQFHLKRELGDILWYWIQGCIAIGVTPEEVIEENIKKLSKRYPQGFEVMRSEVRDVNDI